MICPVETARDKSALRAARVGDHAEHGILLEGRDGAGNESTGCDFASHGEEDRVVAGGGDPWDSDRHIRRWRERYVEEGYNRLFDRQRGKPSRRWVPMATLEKVFALREEVFRSERGAFSREAGSRTRDRAELQLGEAGAAGERVWWGGGASVERIGNGASVGPYRGCCCTSTGAGTSGFRTSAGTT